MSADNGYILRKNEDEKFVLQMYFASADEYPPIDSLRAQTFDTLEEAVAAYEEIEEKSDIRSEYGLSVQIKRVTRT